VLSFDVGVAKPDPAIFNICPETAGSRGAKTCLWSAIGAEWDSAAVALGIATLLLPELRAATDLRLHRVLDLAFP
jgi:FMN phosphatase YigB (HAD superfamily)